MKKKSFGLLACMLLLVILGAVYFIITRPKETAEEDAAATESPAPSYQLTDRSKDDLVKINFKGNSGEKDITMSLDDTGSWISDNYAELPIKQSGVTSVVTYIAALSSDKLVIEGAENLGEYGLSPALLTVTGYYGDGTSESILIGAQTPGKDYYYVAKPGENTVYMVSSYIGNLFNRSYPDFVDTSSPEIDLYNLRYMYFYNGNIPLEAFYSDAEESDSSSPSVNTSSIFATTPIKGKSLYLDNVKGFITDFLANITFSEMVEVVSSGDEKYGFDNPKMKIVFDGITVDENGAETGTYYYQLVIGSDVEGEPDYAYAKFGNLPCVYKVEKAKLSDLYAANPYKMLDKFITLIYINDVESIIIETPDVRYDMKINGYKSYSDENDTEGYDEIAPTVDGMTIKDSVFRDFYQLLIGMTMDSVIDDFTPSGEPVMTITYKMKNGEAEGKADSVTNYYEYDANFYAIEQQGECHFVINKTTVNRMFKNIEVMKAGKEEMEY